MPARKDSGADREIDRLFQLPLEEFTAARNTLASELKRSGDADDAARVGGLAKPPLSAWVVNQLFWRHQPEFTRLRQVGDTFRETQRAQLAGQKADVRGALDARREALSALMGLAPELLRESGHAATPDTMRRIGTTLEALATYGTLPEAPPAGRLMQDLKPLGFETLAALVPRPGDGRRGEETPKVLPFARIPEKKLKPAYKAGAKRIRESEREAERRAKRAAAQKAADDAEAALRDARRAAQALEAKLKKAAAHAKTTQRVKDAMERRFDKVAATAAAASKEAHRIARDAEDAAQAITDAERDLERARDVLKKLE